MRKKLYTFLSISLLIPSLFSAHLYAQDNGKPPIEKPPTQKPPITGPPIIIVGDPDPKKDPCRHAPELPECGGDGGEPKEPKNPKEPKEPEKKPTSWR